VLNDDELARVIIAARQIGGPYGGIVEVLALTGQRREEGARCVWNEIDLHNRIWTLPNLRTKNAKPHIAHLSDQAIAVLSQAKKQGKFVFSVAGSHPFQQGSFNVKVFFTWLLITTPTIAWANTPSPARAHAIHDCVTKAVKQYKYKPYDENGLQRTAIYRGCMYDRGEVF
jgi:integrase